MANQSNKEKWTCKVCNQQVTPQGAQRHFESQHEDIWDEYKEEHGDNTWNKIKEDGYIEKPPKKEYNDPPVNPNDNDNDEDPFRVDIIDPDLQEIEVDGRTFTPEELIWEHGYQGVNHLMELKLNKLLKESSIRNKNLIVRQFRLHDAYKNPQNPQALQSLIKDLAPNSTNGVVQTIISEVFLIPWYYKDTIERAMQHNPMIFDPNKYPDPSKDYIPSTGNPGFGAPNPNPNPNPNPGPGQGQVQEMQPQQNPQHNTPFWYTGNSGSYGHGYGHPSGEVTPADGSGGLTKEDIKEVVDERMKAWKKAEEEKAKEEYIKELEKKVEKLEKGKRGKKKGEIEEDGEDEDEDDEEESTELKKLRKQVNEISRKLEGGKKGGMEEDYDLSNPVGIVNAANDIVSQVRNIGGEEDSEVKNKLGELEKQINNVNGQLDSNRLKKYELDNQLEIKKEDSRAVTDAADRVATALEQFAQNMGMGLGNVMGQGPGQEAGQGAGTGAGPGPGPGDSPGSSNIYVDNNHQIRGVCPSCGNHFKAPVDSTKITCRSCNHVIFDKDRDKGKGGTGSSTKGKQSRDSKKEESEDTYSTSNKSEEGEDESEKQSSEERSEESQDDQGGKGE